MSFQLQKYTKTMNYMYFCNRYKRKAMKKSAVTFVLLLVVTLTVMSCGNRARGILERADSLISHKPDSVIALLRKDSVTIANAGKSERMMYLLLKTEAEDKMYMPHLSDSAMLVVTSYYDRHGQPLQRIRSYYELGRVYCDMCLYGSALSAFDKAMKIEAKDDTTAYEYKMRAAEWTGIIYSNWQVYDKALAYNNKSYDYAKLTNNVTCEIYTLRDIGRCYSNIGKNKAGIPYYKEAAEKALALGDNILYNMVMEELASIYCEEKMYKEAQKCLSVPFFPTANKNDVSSHYFITAYFYQCIGKNDSAIIYNKKGMKYGSKEYNSVAALDLARLYKDCNDNAKAIEYYELHELYEDSLREENKVEHEDFIKHIEKNINSERRNVALAKERLLLVIIVFAIIIISLIAIMFLIKWHKAKKRFYNQQRERARIQWEKTHADDLENIITLEEEIRTLKIKLTSSKEKQSVLRDKLKEAEESLAKQNEQMISEQDKIECLIADFERSTVYQQFHNFGFEPNNEDFKRLEIALSVPYDDFTHRLKKLCPIIQNDELQICCLVKIGLKSKEICNLMHFQANVLSMKRLRLYQKFFNKKGSATEFDAFIRNF